MPVKLRRAKRKARTITREAVARWREVRPHGIEVQQGGGGYIADDDLAAALGEHSLLAMADARELVNALEDAICP